MGKVNCAKCNLSFEEARDRWPPNICDRCLNGTTCNAEGCAKTVEMDPTIHHGLTRCRDHRLLACHYCGAFDKFMHQKACDRCHLRHAMGCVDGDACRGRQRTSPRACIASRDKIPPSYLDAIKIATVERLGARSDLTVSKDKLPLNYGAGALGAEGRDLSAPMVYENQARAHAEAIYLTMLRILLGGAAPSFTTDESTYAVTLLYQEEGAYGANFRIIVTYSQYDRSYTSTKLRDVGEVDKAMIEANPEYKLVSGRHQICRKGSWAAYKREGNNEHHAEARALLFASENKMQILSIMPTKDYCTTGETGGCRQDVKTVLKEELFTSNNERLEAVFEGGYAPIT